MKILFIIPWVPYPLHSGGNQAFFNMLDSLRREHKITLVPCCYSAADREAANELQKVWPDVVIESYVNSIKNELKYLNFNKFDQCRYALYNKLEASMRRKQARMVRKLKREDSNRNQSWAKVGSFDLGSFVKENSTLFRSALELTPEYLNYIYNKSREGFDMIQVEFFECLPLVYVLPENVRRVFVHHEIRFIRNENEANLFDSYSALDQVRFNRLKDEELSALRRYNDVIVLTETDKKILSPYLPDTNICVSPALTSVATVSGKTNFKPGKDLVFIGGSDHFPNTDGVLWFAIMVMPILKKNGFDGNVFVVGKWSDYIKSIVGGITNDIQFTGYVDDLYGFINGKITIVPIRIGSGMRMKILDAIVSNSPMVTTSKGSEGLPFENEVDCLTADDAESFAQCIIRLQKDEKLQASLATNAALKKNGILDVEKLLQTRMNFYKQ